MAFIYWRVVMEMKNERWEAVEGEGEARGRCASWDETCSHAMPPAKCPAHSSTAHPVAHRHAQPQLRQRLPPQPLPQLHRPPYCSALLLLLLGRRFRAATAAAAACEPCLCFQACCRSCSCFWRTRRTHTTRRRASRPRRSSRWSQPQSDEGLVNGRPLQHRTRWQQTSEQPAGPRDGAHPRVCLDAVRGPRPPPPGSPWARRTFSCPPPSTPHHAPTS